MKFLKPILYAFFGGLSLWLCAGDDLPAIGLGQTPGPDTAAHIALLLLGMVMITHGGDLFTDSAVAIARATRIPPVIIGGTLVSLATTFPEFMVSFTGAVSGVPDFAVGNALGSCCCNIGLIVGLCAVLNGWIARKRREDPGIPMHQMTIIGPGLFMLGAGLLVFAFSLFDNAGLVDDGKRPILFAISRWQAGTLFAVFLAYLGYSLRIAYLSRFESRGTAEEEESKEIREHLGIQLLLFLIGAALVVLGSRFLVANAKAVAETMEVPERVIALTVLAIGTSLPELTISVMAVVKQHGSLGIGNIIGANVLNIGWVVATCAFWAPLPIRRQTVLLDAPVVLLLMSVMLVAGYRKERVSPRLGMALFGIYLAWLLVLMVSLLDSG
ncbi:MAG: calcium/sodium antiporter [Planctomycetaceae bacterium]